MQMKKAHILLGLALVSLPISGANAEVTFKYVSAGDAVKMIAGDKPPMIADTSVFSMSLHKRTISSHVEKHMGWDEELVIQQGDVLLNYGGDGVNAVEHAPGEFNADKIANGRHQMLHPGDIVIIPAGTWHEQVIKTPLMRYILFKTKK
jgi:mannose-6-phosphate isomerase-like protein (cupin superfamily)